MVFEIQTHGTSGNWSPLTSCQSCKPIATWGQAETATREIKSNGYGVRLYAAGVLVVDAPWQVQIEEIPFRFGQLVDKAKTREQVLRLDQYAAKHGRAELQNLVRSVHPSKFMPVQLTFEGEDFRYCFGGDSFGETVSAFVRHICETFDPEPATLADVFEALRDCAKQLEDDDIATAKRFDFSDDYNNFTLTIEDVG